MNKYHPSYKFFDTEDQARAFCEAENKSGGRYQRKKYPAHYHEWKSSDGTEIKFVAWYYYKIMP